MRLDSFRHKGLQRLYEDDNARGVPADKVEKLRDMLLSIETAENIEQVGRFPGWKLHPLKPSGWRWGLTVTRNVRLTFRYNPKTNAASDIDLEDYH